jgi:putative Mn2+ efflux pump MntP
MLFFSGFMSCCMGVLAAQSAYAHFSLGKAIAAVLLIALGIWLIRQGWRAAADDGFEDGPDLFALLDAAGDGIDLFDD